MGIEAKHPGYVAEEVNWELMRDCYAGQRAVKERTTAYLPITGGQRKAGVASSEQDGYQEYQAYLARALFPDFVKDAVDRMVGVMHREPSNIELPAKLEPLRARATADGESLTALLRRINLNQLLYGRYGLLLEAPDGAGVDSALPFFAPYSALRIINWDIGPKGDGRHEPRLVVLDEGGDAREEDSFDWTSTKRHRVLVLTPAGEYGVATVGEEGASGPGALDYKVPEIGGLRLDSIPFVFVNPSDLVSDVASSPLLGLANLSMTVYRGEADYRQTLFMQGQETLVIVGLAAGDEDEVDQVGAGWKIDLPIGGDAKYVGVSADGLGEMRQALENDKDDAAQKGAQLLADRNGERQSGEALHVRVAASTATLASMAINGAESVERLLKVGAAWVGADPDEVKVEPNVDFIEEALSGQELVAFMTARAQGAPLSRRSIHRVLKRKDMTDMTYEEEVAQLELEMAEEIPFGPDPEPDDPRLEDGA